MKNKKQGRAYISPGPTRENSAEGREGVETMQTMIETETRRARDKIAAIERGIEAMHSLPEMAGITRMHASDVAGGRVFVVAAYDLTLYRQNRRTLAGASWVAERAYVVSKEGSRYIELKHGDERLTYIMKTTAPGSTCTREKVSEVAQPVYRVSCG